MAENAKIEFVDLGSSQLPHGCKPFTDEDKAQRLENFRKDEKERSVRDLRESLKNFHSVYDSTSNSAELKQLRNNRNSLAHKFTEEYLLNQRNKEGYKALTYEGFDKVFDAKNTISFSPLN